MLKSSRYSKIKILLAVISAVSVLQISAESRISEFKFNGLKRTQESVIQNDLKKFIGKEVSDETLHDIESVLQNENLFTGISIECSPVADSDETVIKISLEEKMTVLLLPIAMVSDGEFSGGAFFMDTNCAGRKNSFIAGGLFSAKSMLGMAMFAKPPKDFIPGFSAFVQVSKSDTEISDPDDRTVLEYGSKYFSGQIGITERLNEFFSVSAESGFSVFKIDSGDEIKGSVESQNTWKCGTEILFETADWNGIFMSEKSASAKANLYITTNQDTFSEIEIATKIQHPVTDRLRYIQNASGAACFDNPITFYKSRHSAAVSLFPSDFLSDRLAGISAGLEYAALQTKIGVFSIFGTYQAATAKDLDGEYFFNHGAGGGMRMYLSKIAFPACSLEIVYNMTEKRFDTGFSLGMSF